MSTPNTNYTLPEGVSESMMLEAFNNPGAVVSNSPRLSTAPRVSVPIDGYASSIRPAADVPLVSKPNLDRFNKAHAQRRLDELDAQAQAEAERQALSEVINPQKLQSTLSAMSRQIAKLQKTVKTLEQKIDGN